MLVDHGKTNCRTEKVTDRRNHTTFRGLVDQNNHKESKVPELASRNSYERWIISTVTSLPTNAYWKLSSFLPPLQVADWKNHFGARAPSSMDGLQSLSLPSSTNFQVDMLSENTDSVKLVSFSSSSGANNSGQSQNRNKLDKPVNSSSSTSPPSSSLVSGNSSCSVNNLSADCSSLFINNIPVVEKVVKRYPRTSRKKGKLYKQTVQEKVSSESDVQCNRSAYSAFASEKSVESFLSYSNKQVFDNLSDKAMPSCLSVQDFTVDGENNNEQMDCSTTSESCTLYGDEMDDSELIASPQKFGSKKFSCNSVTCQNIASTTTQAAEIVLSTFDEYIKDFHGIANSNFHDNSLSTSMDKNVSAVDSFLDGWNCNVAENFGDCTEMQSTLEKEGRANTSEGVLSSGSRKFDTSFHTENVVSCVMNTEMSKNHCIGNSSNDINPSCNAETVECSSQACSSHEFHPVLSGRRERMRRKVIGSQNINVANRFQPANSQGSRGKGTKCPVWQKLHKSDTEACDFKPHNVSVLSPKDDVASNASKTIMICDKILRMKEKTRRSCKYPCADETYNTELCQVASNAVKPGQLLAKPTVDNLTDNVESKSSSVLKQANHFSMSRSFTVKSYVPKVLKHHGHNKEGLQTSLLVHHERTSLGSPSSTYSQHKPADLVDHCQSKPAQGTRALGKVLSPSNVCSMERNRSLPAAHIEIGQLPEELHSYCQKLTKVDCETCNSMYSMDMCEGFSRPGTEYNSCMKLETESSYTKSCNLQHVTRTMPKWVSLWKKKSVVSDIGHDLGVLVVDEVDNKSDSRDAEVDVMISNKHDHPPNGDGFPSSNSSSREAEISTAEFAPSPIKPRICSHSAEAICGLDALSNCQSHELKNQEISPVANFENFLYSASPVIGQAHCNTSCSTCEEQLIGHPLCWHQIPNISLKSLWHWYEEPGCFGLEVKAQDYSILDNSTFEFNAYFVPYLSAVQLFGNSMSTRHNLIGESTISSKVDQTSSTSSNLESLPIFAKLLPRPQKEIGGCFSRLSSTHHDPVELVKTKNPSDGKLIFEFFESDQPPCRRPLFEKIKELVGGHTSRNTQIFGDPLNLESMNLHDLHPASWFSVAWYPIYRIPDGKFRAAFLTYHSLGHFVHQSVSSCSPSALTPIVCPVVGLLAYNDKGESWFQLRYLDSKAIQSEEVLCSNPSELLKERLRTLKQTASLMARAVVSKGNQKSANQHPDHEFFLSRN